MGEHAGRPFERSGVPGLKVLITEIGRDEFKVGAELEREIREALATSTPSWDLADVLDPWTSSIDHDIHVVVMEDDGEVLFDDEL